jgi:putative flippase GtrA
VREGRLIGTHIQRLLRRRIVRYALVGGIGIPINLFALAVFKHLFTERLYVLAVVASFEVSTTINFVLNQTFTYSEQRHLQGWDWPKRALKAQAASSSGLLLQVLLSLTFKYGLHMNGYVAQVLGITIVFFYNFVVSNRLVFRPAPTSSASAPTSSAPTPTPTPVSEPDAAR